MNGRALSVLNYLLSPEVYTVFDIDGTMAVYQFGDLRHSACNDKLWEQFVKENKPYSTMVEAVPQVQRFIQQKCKVNSKSVHVCSVSQNFERGDKLHFVLLNFPTIDVKNIHFVESKAQKIDLLRELATDTSSEEKVALIDDTVKTLDGIYEQSKFITVHNSVFMMY